MSKNALHTCADVLSDQLEIPSQTAPVGDGHLMPIFLLVPLSEQGTEKGGAFYSAGICTRRSVGARALAPRLETDARAVNPIRNTDTTFKILQLMLMPIRCSRFKKG